MGMKKSLLAACVLSGAAAAHADVKAAPGYCNTTYEVTITNLTLAQVLSPPLVDWRMFTKYRTSGTLPSTGWSWVA